MKKITILGLVFLLVVINSYFGYCEYDFHQKVNKLTGNLVKNAIKENSGYLIKIEGKKVYFNLGSNSGVRVGDRFKVFRTEDLLVDPTTGMRLGEVTRELAEIEATKVQNNFSIANVVKFYSSSSLKRTDKVKQLNKKIGVVKFTSPEDIIDLAGLTRQYIINYLTDQENIELISTDKIDKMIKELNLKPPFSKSDLKLISDNLKIELLITGEIYEGKDELFLRGRLFEANLNNISREEVEDFSLDNNLIQYYKARANEGEFSYQKLLASKLFEYKGLSVEIADVDKDRNQEIILVLGNELRVLTYQDDKLIPDGEVSDYHRTKYDDYKIVAGNLNENQNSEIFAENFNQLVKFTLENGEYTKDKVSGFMRNRPKEIINLKGKKYLITRDYLHYLKFNINREEEYITDFQLKLKENEGYRIQIADIDKDKQEELILTAYQEENNYKIKIYNLEGELEGILPGVHGSGMAIIEDALAVQSTNEDKQQVIIYKYSEGEYKKRWTSEGFDLTIKDLASGDVNNDGVEELVILLGDETQSKLYIYAKRKGEKSKE